jgi:hypothetical protein
MNYEGMSREEIGKKLREEKLLKLLGDRLKIRQKISQNNYFENNLFLLDIGERFDSIKAMNDHVMEKGYMMERMKNFPLNTYYDIVISNEDFAIICLKPYTVEAQIFLWIYGDSTLISIHET